MLCIWRFPLATRCKIIEQSGERGTKHLWVGLIILDSWKLELVRPSTGTASKSTSPFCWPHQFCRHLGWLFSSRRSWNSAKAYSQWAKRDAGFPDMCFSYLFLCLFRCDLSFSDVILPYKSCFSEVKVKYCELQKSHSFVLSCASRRVAVQSRN